MLSRIGAALAVALMVMLLIAMPVLAKGNFSFITIMGSELKEPARVTDVALTADFFAFADFFRGKTAEPVNPGTGYEVTRFYMGNNVAVPFDRLHYYPNSGLVYYDGIAGGGSSEYDRKWYAAKPAIKVKFENALASQLPSRGLVALYRTNRIQPVLFSIAIAGLVLASIFALRFRRATTH